jgi:hypothetical protein
VANRAASPVAPTVDKTHWAYLQGRTAGVAGNTTERGIMAFGLGCAADAATAHNTRLWLAGFDDGLAAQAQSRLDAQKHRCAYPDDGMRPIGHRYSA